MRKTAFFLVVLVLCLAAALPGLCQVLSFDSVFATVEIPDSYTILTPYNMENHMAFLQNLGTTMDIMLRTFDTEGILLQAYGKDGDTLLQISALKDVDAQNYFDLDQQSSSARAKYRREHLEGDTYRTLGITYDSAEWRKTSAYGRFLMLKYIQRIGDKVDHRGFARRTIRNGYTITVDYQVFDRSLSGKDNNALNDVMDTWRFTELLPIPGNSAAHQVEFDNEPPKQTNNESFTVSGICTPGAQITGSVLRMGAADPVLVQDITDKSGKFSLSVVLPQEGVYVMAITVSMNGVVTEEMVLPEITFDKTLLPVNFNDTVPDDLTTDQLVISGTTDKGVTVECIVNGESTKKKTGRGGEFSFKIKTAEEGNYSITIAFSKEGLADQRYTYYAVRTWSEEEKQAKIRKEAIKPAHTTLTKKISGYTGRIMGYNTYVTKIDKSGDQWIIYLAFRQIKSVYRDIIVVMTQDEPAFTVDSQVKMYGRCTGLYQLQDGASLEEYPSFDLLFWDDAD